MNTHVTLDSFASKLRYWTEEEHATVVDLAGRGFSDERIAISLRRTSASVKRYRDRHHIRHGSRSLWSVDNDVMLRQLFSEGLDDDQIAHAMGRTTMAIATRRKILALHRREAQRAPVVRRKQEVTAASLLGARPCPINADNGELVHANRGYLIAAMRAGHQVYNVEDLPKLYRIRGEL